MKPQIFINLFFLSLIILSCDLNKGTSPPEENKDSASSDTAKVQKNSYAVLVTNVDQLRLRRYCDLKSTMVTTFDENTALYFLEDSTDFKDKIGSYRGPWLKVRSIDGSHEGWVYGASHFISWMINKPDLDSMHTQGKDIRLFNNLNKTEMTKLTGARWSKNVKGTRYSGFYQYNIGGDPQLIDGIVKIRARVFDTEKRQVRFVPCELTVEEGMPATEISCFEEKSLVID